MRIKIKNYTYSNKFNKKILLFSDIHYYSKKDKKVLNKLLKITKKLKPDYICIAGDLIDTNPIYDKEILLDFFSQLTDLATVIIGLGNHDIKNLNKEYVYDEKLWNSIKKTKCHVLDNETFNDGNVTFLGITLPFSFYLNKEVDDIGDYINDKLKSKVDIVLIHSPLILNNTELPKNILFLFGHMHGGLVPGILRPIFKNRGLISPRKKLFPKFVYGFIKDKNSIISGGVQIISPSNSYQFLKYFYSGEVVLIDI